MSPNTEQLAAPKDNLTGICHALGEDFGFNPLWIRLALAAAFVLQPVGVIATYLALGGLVLISRLVFPDARPVAPVVERHAAEQQDEDVVLFAKAA